jgi:hypothetical protein
MSTKKRTVRSGEKRSASSDRDPRGRFVPGNAAGVGHGRPKSRHELEGAIRAAVTPEELVQVIRALLARALRGDVRAATVVLDRLLGRVPIRVEDELGDDWTIEDSHAWDAYM